MRPVPLFAGCLIAASLVALEARATPVTFDTPGLYTYTVPESGTYAFTVIGAAGGNGADYYRGLGGHGGLGAKVGGSLTLTANETLSIVVGGHGEDGNDALFRVAGSGGGGGSFVFDPGSAALFVAGGGGGGGGAGGTVNGLPGLDASLGPDGENGTGYQSGQGGQAGQGGQGATYASGGGGLLSPGGTGDFDYLSGGSAAGGAGGTALYNHGGLSGGYGGGGAGYASGGGGGGYSGGGAAGGYSSGGGGGGGGSFVTASAFDTLVPTNVATTTRDGLVRIELLSAIVPVPEPSSLVLVGSALAMLLVGRRRTT